MSFPLLDNLPPYATQKSFDITVDTAAQALEVVALIPVQAVDVYSIIVNNPAEYRTLQRMIKALNIK